MNAIDATAIPSRTARRAGTSRRTNGISIITGIARIATGLVWVVLSVAMSLAMLDATFGYSATGPAAHPAVITRPVDDGAATRVTETDTPKPGAGPAPMLEAQ